MNLHPLRPNVHCLLLTIPLAWILSPPSDGPVRAADPSQGQVSGAVAHWPRFRGPTGQGTAEVDHPPIEFDLTRGLVWRTPIAGKGWSSPVISGRQIWLTTAVTHDATEEEREKRLADVKNAKQLALAGSLELRAVCIDADSGEVIHDVLLASHADPDPIHSLNSYASPTPVIDAGRIYCHFGTFGTWCLATETGETIWMRQYVINHGVGPGSSPALHNDQLILVFDGMDQQFIVSLDKASGEENWKTYRPPFRVDDPDRQKSYSTPMLINVEGVDQAVIAGAQWIVAYAPESGEEIWRVDHGSGFSLGVTPIYTDGQVIFSTGFSKPTLVSISPTGRGDVTESHVRWRIDKSVPTKPSPVVVGQWVWMIDDLGILSCIRPSDGEVLWRKRVAGNYSASPLLVGDYLYVCNQDGVVTVLRADSDAEEIARNTLDTRIMASPAVIDEDLIIRSEESLMRFTRAKEPGA